MAKLVIGTSNQAVIPSIVKRVEVPISTGKYSLLNRVVDDSNNSIGTVVGFHTDANNVEYAVVCLDAAYRLSSASWMSSNTTVSGIPKYTNITVYDAPETATTNCGAILATAQTQGLTSPAVSHCRAQTFTIDGVNYAGQLPTLMELIKIFGHRTRVNAADPTASQYSSLVVGAPVAGYWSSNVYIDGNYGSAWLLTYGGAADNLEERNARMVLPVLEIPNAL